MSIIGKMFTNFSDLEVEPNQVKGCGYYPTYANMNHACRANTKTFKYPDQRLEVRAQVSITKGEDISTQYMKSMKATFARRPVLRSNWFFDCSCERCEDPEEFGSFVSALLCTRPAPSNDKTCAGTVLSINPTVGDANWQCCQCSAIYDSQHVLNIINYVSSEVKNCPEEDVDTVHHYERVLHQFSTMLHPHHYQVIEIKEKLAQILGNFAPYTLHSMPRHLKERKRQLCQDVLDVIARVDPGFTKTRGLMLSEMNKVNLILAKEDLSKSMDDIVYKKQWERACLEKQFLHMYLAYYQNLFHSKL